MLTISQGVRRGCYSGDIGIGYASIVHSTSTESSPEKQASLVIIGIFLDTFVICTMSIMVILVTGIWNQPLRPQVLVQTALSQCIPFIGPFIPLFLTIVGFSTIVTYFYVGLTCAHFVSPRYGKVTFYLYAIIAFLSCTVVDTSQTQTIMALFGGLLLVINGWGIFRLRRDISFHLGEKNEFKKGEQKLCAPSLPF